MRAIYRSASDASELCIEGKNIMFHTRNRLKERSWKNNAMSRPISKRLYKAVQQAVMSNEDGEVFRNECSKERPESFVGLVQLFSDKPATTLSSTVVVAYSGHVVLLNVSAFCNRWLVKNGITLLGILPVSMETSEKRTASRTFGRYQELYWCTRTNGVKVEKTSK